MRLKIDFEIFVPTRSVKPGQGSYLRKFTHETDKSGLPIIKLPAVSAYKQKIPTSYQDVENAVPPDFAR